MESKSGKSKFACVRCGTCCSWPGYVIVSAEEADAIAAHLNLDPRDFLAKFAKLTSSRKNISLKEKENGECIFFDPKGKSCQIYGLRPSQCRRFPSEWNFPGWEKECKGGQMAEDRRQRTENRGQTADDSVAAGGDGAPRKVLMKSEIRGSKLEA